MGDNFFISLNMNYGAGFRSTARRNLFTLTSMSEELSALRQSVERLEQQLELAAGGEDALGGRLDNLEAWLKEVSIEKGEARISKLEEELQGYDLYDIEQGVETQEKRLDALEESLAVALEALRREARESSEELAEMISGLSSGLEVAQEAIDDQAKKTDELGSKIELEVVEREKQLARGKTGLQEVRRDVSADASHLRSLQLQYDSQQSQFDSLQRQLNQANAEIVQLRQAIGRPSISDQILGFVLGLALLVGFGWLAIKAFNWMKDLI
jgi:chromosome segregation ATPase